MIKRGSIYWVNLDPTIGSEIAKKRPAVIISNDTNNQFAATVTIVPITSGKGKTYPFEVPLSVPGCNLNKDSRAKANQIRTVSISRMGNFICHLPEHIIKEIEKSIQIHLGII